MTIGWIIPSMTNTNSPSADAGIVPAILIKPYISNLVHRTDFWINLAQNSDKRNRNHNTEGTIQRRLYMLLFWKALKNSWSVNSPLQNILCYHQIYYLSMAFHYLHPGIVNPMLYWPRGQLSFMVYWTPLFETEPSMYGKLNPHGILNPLITNHGIGRGFDLPKIACQNTLGRGPIYHGYGFRNTIGNGSAILWVRGLKIPWVGVL